MRVVVRIAVVWGILAGSARAYPPAVGIVGKNKNCLACHSNDGPWKEGPKLVVDLVDAKTKKSLRQADGSFEIRVKRGEVRSVITVLGFGTGGEVVPPARNGWLFLDPSRIMEDAPGNKFAAGWEADVTYGCRQAGDPWETDGGAVVTAAPMRLRPGPDAKNATLELHAMLTDGKVVKGSARKGMLTSVFVRTVRLVVDPAPPEAQEEPPAKGK